VEVWELGDLGWKSFENAFKTFSELRAVSGGKTGSVVAMGEMFRQAGKLREVRCYM
jgi:hypothetical protein